MSKVFDTKKRINRIDAINKINLTNGGINFLNKQEMYLIRIFYL